MNGLDCSMIRNVRVPHEQFVAIKNKAGYLIVEDRDKGGCITFTRDKEMSDEETNKMIDDMKIELDELKKKTERLIKIRERQWGLLMNNITVNMDNLSTDERNTLLKLIEKANKPKNKVWKPYRNERYYTIFYDGTLTNLLCTNDDTGEKTFTIGNCFKTKEEAEFALEKQKVITELKRFALENNECELDWNNRYHKYYLYYNYKTDKIEVIYDISYKTSSVYFSSEDIAKKAIETIGEDRVKKYYLEVNDNE